jgi:hypothetical protein
MYTALMKRSVRTIPIPKQFKIDILDYDTFLTIQFYESQWRHYSETERFLCIQYLDKVKKTLENLGAKVALDPILDIKHNRVERR